VNADLQPSMTTPRRSSTSAAAVAEPELPPARDLESAVEAKDFSFWYGSTQALDGISLTVPTRKVTALIGPSGCGESTFLRSINRMNDLIPGTRHDGDITLDGDSVYRNDRDVVQLRKSVGMVFQKSNPFPKSIYQNVAYGPKVNRLVRGRAEMDELVERSLRQAALWDEVKDRLDSSALGLSGGQQQRLCIARALAVSPEVILIVTHNMQQAARVSDYTAFFYMGRLIEMGRTQQIFTNPGEDQTEAYITGRFG